LFVIPELHSSAALFEECPSNTPKLAIDLIPPSLGFECEMRAQYLSSPFWPRRLATAYDQSGPLSLSVIILDRGSRNNLPGLLSPDPPTCGSVRAVGPSHPQIDGQNISKQQLSLSTCVRRPLEIAKTLIRVRQSLLWTPTHTAAYNPFTYQSGYQ